MKCYISGPMRLGHWHLNLRQGIDAAEALFVSGITPVCPQLSFLWDVIYPHTFEDWLRIDLELVEACDALLRLPGQSEGADREVAKAHELGIPVFLNIPQVLEHYAVHFQVRSGHA